MPEDRNPYRFGFSFMERWTRWLKAAIWISLATALALGAIGLVAGGTMDGRVPAESPWWTAVWAVLGAAAAVLALGILVPLLAAFVLGGLAIHRYGWIPGLAAFAGILGTAVGFGLDDYLGDRGATVGLAGIAVLVAGVLGFFLVGCLAKVPMWIGTGGARLSLTRGGAEGERPSRGGRR
ncbi:hypothetical protein GCM10023224_42980 [Streptomonospora halophila]|uniref:Uncharacterized protein n=1 Tax=Streptomonospora halophila TaxID=427369 RepID=A0ABP9H272_9ACTN